MTILTDLTHLDVSTIINGRGSITSLISSADLQKLMMGGIGPGALGEFGVAITELQAVATKGPSALLEPVAQALSGLVGGLSGGHLPIDRYVEAVKEAASLILGLFDGFTGNPGDSGKGFGLSLDGLLGSLSGSLSSLSSVGLDQVASLGQIVHDLESGVPSDPAAFADLAIRALFPFPATTLRTMRGHVDVIVSGTATLALPTGRTDGLVKALVTVALAAPGDGATLQRALADLDQARVNTVAMLSADLAAVSLRLHGLDIEPVLDALTSAGTVLGRPTQGILEFLDGLGADIAHAHTLVDSMDPAMIKAVLTAGMQMAKSQADQFIGSTIDGAVERVRQWLEGLLGHLGIAQLRGEITSFLHGIASTIADSGLDAPVRAMTEALDKVASLLNGAALAAEIQAALHHVADVVSQALDGVINALAQIKNAISGLAAQAKPVLEQAAAALTTFKQAVDQAVQAIDGLAIDKVTAQVSGSIDSLRQSAQAVLTAAPLPDALRAPVDQLIQQIQGIDLASAIEDPVRHVLDQFHIPDSVKSSLDGVVAAARHLVPTEAIASLNAEISEVLNELTHLHPGDLLSGLTGLFQEVASAIDHLDPRPLPDAVEAPFKAVLAGIDAIEPTKLLQPVIAAFDSLMGAVAIPSPSTGAGAFSTVIASVGETLGSTLTAPVQNLVPSGNDAATGASAGSLAANPVAGGSGTGAAAGPAGSTGSGGTDGAGPVDPSSLPAGVPDVHPGDIIRFLGYIPRLLRAGLASLEAGPAGQALEAIDNLVAGLARDLRSLAAAIWAVEGQVTTGLDTLLAPLATAQLEAQAALTAHAAVHAEGGGVDVQVSVAQVALAGPGAMQALLAGPLARVLADVAGAASSAGGQRGGILERVADALDRAHLSTVTGSLDALLAALDPEPLAVELDSLVAAALAKMPDVMAAIKDDVVAAGQLLQQFFNGLNAGALLQRFLPLLNVVREQLDLVNPRRLAMELGEIHHAVQAVVASYDPAVLVGKVGETISAVSAGLRALNPSTLLGDTSFLQPIVDRIQQASPVTALSGIASELDTVAADLAAIDLTSLVDAVNGLPPKVESLVSAAVEAVKKAILDLLEALRFGGGSVTATLSVSGSVEG